MSAWLLPDHIADVLPSEARHIEELRRQLLDAARSYGYELVIPPLIEHLDSLLTGTGETLELQTFKLVDQLSGRSLGLRADTTPQVARIDAHLLGRQAITRLCYCGPVLHTRPERAHGTREPLQFGAEIYGHAGREADLEILTLALDCLDAARVGELSVDLADARIVRALLAGVMVDPRRLAEVHAALAAKDASELARLTQDFPAQARERLRRLLGLYGGAEVLDEAETALAGVAGVPAALSNLRWLAARLPGVRVSFDLADARGWGYYTGARFAVYAEGAGDALLRGGRYDGVGAVFGHKLDRERPAVGFSLDIKQLVRVAAGRPPRAAICAPWSDAPGLRAAVTHLRGQGETVICALPGHDREIDEFHCDRELVEVAGQWVVKAME
ncbi:MAG: ATP phosphoribosyltransferase regulatory subunit [Burkholderiales bacterium]|nr:ATP phosphoribosyltransferase regulatory subunit [Burkholderiales bacterium]